MAATNGEGNRAATNGEGNRKVKAFNLSSIGLFILAGIAIFMKGDPTQIFTLYAGAQAGIGAAFFGANFGEHWSKAKQEAKAKITGD